MAIRGGITVFDKTLIFFKTRTFYLNNMPIFNLKKNNKFVRYFYVEAISKIISPKDISSHITFSLKTIAYNFVKQIKIL